MSGHSSPSDIDGDGQVQDLQTVATSLLGQDTSGQAWALPPISAYPQARESGGGSGQGGYSSSSGLAPVPMGDADEQGQLDAAQMEERRREKVALLRVRQPRFMPDEFGLTITELSAICSFDNRSDPSQIELLNSQYGGPEGVAYLLKTDLDMGLPLQRATFMRRKSVLDQGKFIAVGAKEDLEAGDTGAATAKGADMTVGDKDIRTLVFGSNLIPPPKPSSILEIVWETIKDDPIIKVLIVGAVVVLALGTAICPSEGWVEGVAILVAVVIVLSSDKRTKVIRGGIKDQVSSWDLLVGDIVEVVVGDEIPADGIYVSGNRLVVDESPLTGESLPVKKGPSSPYLFSGCQISEGFGTMLVTAVGTRSSGGQIQELLNEAQSEETVLQMKLKIVAVLIGKIGVASGLLTFIGLAIRWAIDWAQGNPLVSDSCGGSTSGSLARIEAIAKDFVIGITVVVVAVPEGLPLAVTVSLAFSMFKMIQDKCFVRHLDASETMGEATCICTDKTGTLTENRMTAVKALVGDQVHYGEGSGEEQTHPFTERTFGTRVRDLLAEGICINSSCFLKIKPETGAALFVGSATEGALLQFAQKIGVHYEGVRAGVEKVENGTWSFSSDRKRMSTLVRPIASAPPTTTSSASSTTAKEYRLYTKGASEIVLGLCTHIIDAEASSVTPLSSNDLARIQRTIKRWASQGLRTIAMAYKDTDKLLTTFEGQGKKDDPEHDLVFIGLVGIKDPLRKEVPGAVAQCQKAGLTIRMVTGDNILTACKIARECNIMYGDGVALEGPVFRLMSEEEKIAILPRLQVLARSSPSDKHTLVSLLRKLGEVVAVTGDGTNDAPALKEADVGFAMGICGTQIAMNASDIVLLDDNFVSLVQSIRWGRNVLNCVRKFLQFQLGVNLAAITLTFVGSVTVGSSPLSTVQLLWVNLIMDSLGALALASEEPEDDILDHPPHSRHENLLSGPMKEYIFMQLVYQITVLLVLLLRGDDIFSPDATFYNSADITGTPSKRLKTLVFTTFILMQVTNEVMARQLNGELNLFRNFFRNKLFLLILAVILIVQVLAIVFGGSFFDTVQMNWEDWVICAVLALVNFPCVFVGRAIALLVHRTRGSSRRVHPEKGLAGREASIQRTTSVRSADVDSQQVASIGGRRGSVGSGGMRDSTGKRESMATPLISSSGGAGGSLPILSSGIASSTGLLRTGSGMGGAYRTTHRSGRRWQTLRSAVVLMNALDDVRKDDFTRTGPDQSFIENVRSFRKDPALPTKNAANTRSAASLRKL
ncbi:hypothetical protein BDK51DRAFT_40529 [Blyttiomyces helicus]|uniref:Calcium-transporting ATPase n=1 Tax=Blyttiomyces helicus TaxID=388810 RepID=A0A4P9WMQ4_9FUNG|nr:hypothetical protein BDK51DRAFT_40529 [Blyttiomyces helicus]|eukprot:RKO94361.1 hypothetical protein BDK51DRAFT_40529 [Blyttiomyces helicus]